MNTKQLKQIAEEEGKKMDETGKVIVEPQDSKKQPELNSFQTKSQIKRHKLNSQTKPERRIRVETEVVPTELYLKTSVAGNAVNCTIGDVRYTIPHTEISKYMEGLTNSIRLFRVQEKQPEKSV